MADFKKLTIWTTGLEIALQCYKLTSKFPTAEKFGLTAQMNRAAVSISSNIAEGSGRGSRIDFNRFVQMAIGSLYELQTQSHIAAALNFSPQDEINKFLNLLDQEGAMLTAFSKFLKSGNKKHKGPFVSPSTFQVSSNW
ncbi:MAG: four helix bundle protein [Chitinophagaceae bacterium]|nr:four helix bundle protein [Chitinophagaceae bacterium]